jgi:hypothetical protein
MLADCTQRRPIITTDAFRPTAAVVEPMAGSTAVDPLRTSTARSQQAVIKFTLLPRIPLKKRRPFDINPVEGFEEDTICHKKFF